MTECILGIGNCAANCKSRELSKRGEEIKQGIGVFPDGQKIPPGEQRLAEQVFTRRQKALRGRLRQQAQGNCLHAGATPLGPFDRPIKPNA